MANRAGIGVAFAVSFIPIATMSTEVESASELAALENIR